MTDRQLLQLFVNDAAQREHAFADLVRRHVHWMYAAALRQVGDPHSAEDVVQAAFIVLAKKAASQTDNVRVT